MENNTGITTILIKGKEIKLRFGLPACQVFYQMCIDDDSEKYINGTKMTGLGIAKLIHAGYENACLVEDKAPEITLGSFIEYTEDMIVDNPKELERVSKIFGDSKYTEKLMEEKGNVDKATEEAKKKRTGNLSNLTVSTNLSSRTKNTSRVRTGNTSSGKRGTNAQKPKERRKQK